MDLSIIVVNYNTCEMTMKTLESVTQSETEYQYEVLLVDNASSDQSVPRIQAAFPNFTVIANKQNLGFAKANNIGIERACGTYILLLNSDVVIQPDTLQIMVAFMENHPGAGASGCKVILPDGKLDQACHRGFPTPFASLTYMLKLDRLFPNRHSFGRYHLSFLDLDSTHSVDALVGAFMLVRRSVIEQAGLLDEDYFMYGEDLDWCYQIQQAGWEICYHPATQVVHYKGASSKKKRYKLIWEFHRAMLLFYKKNMARKYSFPVTAAVYTAIILKCALSMAGNLFKIPKKSVS
ncbi:glycosyltransferase family 2 protein [Marinicrinis sediminis]|uniref:Glycosyltransferase family 2 protein n=1 Tax=Marinicrinis sediminis TaxID=1652465 RepID=A0ABW5RC93_9BACL